jgi:hypothetical protein
LLWIGFISSRVVLARYHQWQGCYRQDLSPVSVLWTGLTHHFLQREIIYKKKIIHKQTAQSPRMVRQKLVMTAGKKRHKKERTEKKKTSQGRSRLFSVQFIIMQILHSVEHIFRSCKIIYNHSAQKHYLKKSVIFF